MVNVDAETRHWISTPGLFVEVETGNGIGFAIVYNRSGHYCKNAPGRQGLSRRSVGRCLALALKIVQPPKKID
jgi:hypothetical protein